MTDSDRENRRRELARRTKADLIRMLQPHIMTAHPLSAWTKDEIVSSLLDREFPRPPAVTGLPVPAGHDLECIYCEHGPYCLTCPPPPVVDGKVCGPCREAITRSEIAADPYYSGGAMFGDGA